MAPSSIAKTAIVTSFGLWELLRMLFSLKNAAQSNQRLMDGVLREVPFAFVYLDDILVASQSPPGALLTSAKTFHPVVLQWADHKPLTFALSSQTDRSPHQTRHLSFIAEFTTDIQHIKGKFNVVADALSRLNTIGFTADAASSNQLNSLTTDSLGGDCINFHRLAKDQVNSEEMASYRTPNTGLVLKDVDIGSSTLLCTTSMGISRPVLPTLWTRPVFNKIHGLSLSGIRPTQKAISQGFVWHGMKRDIRQ
ncbi:Pol polyprotein [Plakobranchus ocellatus]|uniref:Pol polyprotein n=1 Tax=Plakobranchus ocellatus TaxID=259542 RepID=A0AAV4E1W9_9GAST|nr:Pol polyprotein [Plakobranchus ocellatus]